MKRFACLALCLALLACAAPALCQEGVPDQVYVVSDAGAEAGETRLEAEERPEFVTRLLEIAVNELGYEEGPNDFSKYGQWAGDANAAWCAEFICWCVNQTDQRYGTELLEKVYPNYSGQNTGRDWFIARGRFCYRKGNCPGWGYQWLKDGERYLRVNDFIPRAGDLLFFSYNETGDTEHVALVEYCARDGAGDVIVHVIEGNNPSAVQRNRYRLDNSQILGFGLCEDVIGTNMRFGNTGEKVLWLQEALRQLGLLDERHVTGTFGGNTRAAVTAFQTERMTGKNPNGMADRETQQAIEKALRASENSDPGSWLVTE